MKGEADREIMVLESKISELRSNNMSISEVEKILNSAMANFAIIDALYCKSDPYRKRKLIGCFDIPRKAHI